VIACDVAEALSYAHEETRAPHIKPENILLEAGHPVISDFGIARAIREATCREKRVRPRDRNRGLHESGAGTGQKEIDAGVISTAWDVCCTRLLVGRTPSDLRGRRCQPRRQDFPIEISWRSNGTRGAAGERYATAASSRRRCGCRRPHRHRAASSGSGAAGAPLPSWLPSCWDRGLLCYQDSGQPLDASLYVVVPFTIEKARHRS